MNKGELVEQVAKECDLGRAAAERVVASVFGTIANAMKASDKVVLPGFGTFSVIERSAREGRNPKSGEPIEIPAKKVVKFKAGSKLTNLMMGSST